MPSSYVRNAIVLGLLTAMGPFAIDMYLPSLPSVAASFQTSQDAVLASMTVFFIAFAAGQLVFGTSSDLLGRRPPLVSGLILFGAASVGCALATSIEMLIVLRLFQGFGGAAGMVIARAIVRDLHSGLEEARLLSLLMLVFGVSPILAPLIGNVVIEHTGWRGVFWGVTALAGAGLLLIALFVPETRPREARRGAGLRSVLAASRRLLTDRDFVGLIICNAFAISGFFIYLANHPFVLKAQYGFTPREYSVAFSVNAVAFFAAAQFTGALGKRFGLARLIRPAAFGYAATTVLLLALISAGIDSFTVAAALLFVAYGWLGIMLPVSSVLALERHGDIAGTASSLMNAIQLAIGSICIAISGTFADNTMFRMVAAIATCTVIAVLPLLRRGAAEAPVREPHALEA